MNSNKDLALVLSNEAQVAMRSDWEQFTTKWSQFYKDISNEETPKMDGAGRKIVERRPDGMDYIIEAYMRNKLNQYFPGWSWEAAAPVQVVGEWLLAQGHLCIIDPNLAILGINPPIRKFYGCGAARIQFKTEKSKDGIGRTAMPHSHENVIDIDKNVKSANTNALKVSINRLCGIGDDVYGKRIEEEGMGSYENMFLANPDSGNFIQASTALGYSAGEILRVLGIRSIGEIPDFVEAYNKLKQSKGLA